MQSFHNPCRILNKQCRLILKYIFYFCRVLVTILINGDNQLKSFIFKKFIFMLYYSIENQLSNEQVNIVALVYCMIWGWNKRDTTHISIPVIVLLFLLGSFPGYRTAVGTLVLSCFSPARKATDFVRNARLFSVKTSLAFCLNAYCVLTKQALDTGNIQGLF